MARLDDLIFDAWTPASFKRALTRKAPGVGYTPPSWIGENNGRRISAYRVYRSYVDNAARHFLSTTDPEIINEHREYGDADMVVFTTRAALLGDSQGIAVDGAGEFDPDLNEDVLEGLEGQEREQAEEDLADNAEAELRAQRQEFLSRWADEERLILKVMEGERDAITIGDSVFVLSWSSRKRRPRVKVYDAGWYFPVLEDDDEEFPSKVHLAWELEPDEGGQYAGKTHIRRITYEIGLIQPARDADNLNPIVDEETGEVTLAQLGDRVNLQTGLIERDYPWNPTTEIDAAGQERAIPASTVTCYMTDAEWYLEGNNPTVEDLSEARAVYNVNEEGEQIRQLDLGIDFIPVVHVPNSVAEKEHFGRPALARILQILDDLAGADTDARRASLSAGKPNLGVSGLIDEDAKRGRTSDGTPAHLVFREGTVWALGEKGSISVVDLSPALTAINTYVDKLLKRLSVNSALPESVLGRISPADVPSGLALALSWGPLRSLIAEMRLIRGEKYPLLLKMVQRLYQGNGRIPEGADNIYRAEIEFGSFLPADVAATVTQVRDLLGAKAISRMTAVMMLMQAGLPIEDAAAEVARIEAEDLDAAVLLLEATGNVDEVERRLGVPVEEEEEPELQPVVVPDMTEEIEQEEPEA